MYIGWPLSMSHCQVAGIIGTSAGVGGTNKAVVAAIVGSWLVTTLATALIAAALFGLATAYSTARVWPSTSC